MTFRQIQESSPKDVARWANFDPTFSFPGGERLDGFFARAVLAAQRLAADKAETVLAVTHGGVIRAMLCHLLDIAPQKYVAFEIAPASLTAVRLFGGKGVLSEMIRVERGEPS
jgi:broad specificity phosphatase PhoE